MMTMFSAAPRAKVSMMRNNILPRAAASARNVYVITTPNAHLFGIHRRRPLSDGIDETTSHVLGFQELGHAVAMAAGLEAHRDTHGCFPRRDLSISEMNLSASLARQAPPQLTHVSVEQVELDDLLERLSGTSIVLSLLRSAADNKLTWHDVHPASSTTVQQLNNTWHAAQAQQYFLNLPGLCDVYYRGGDIGDIMGNNTGGDTGYIGGDSGYIGGDIDMDDAMPPLLPKPVMPLAAAAHRYHTYHTLGLAARAAAAGRTFDAEAMRSALLKLVLVIEAVCVIMLLPAMM